MWLGKVAIGAWVVISSTSCSFISSRPPPSAPDERTAKAAARCGNIWYPLADTVSVIAGYTWVLYADRAESNSQIGSTTYDTDGRIISQETRAGTNYDSLRYSAYGAMGLFGLSALYGYYVELKCAGLRSEIKDHQSMRTETKAPARPDPPNDILGFTFTMHPQDAERVCMAKQKEWQLQGAVATCKPRSEPATEQPLQLDFQLGTLTRVTVLRKPAAEQLNKNYDDLCAAFRGIYGAPTIDRSPLPAECATSLAACLKSGTKVKGPAWHWSTGSIELQPAWRDDGAFIEERYSHQDQMTN